MDVADIRLSVHREPGLQRRPRASLNLCPEVPCRVLVCSRLPRVRVYSLHRSDLAYGRPYDRYRIKVRKTHCEHFLDRFTPVSDRRADIRKRQLRANSGREQMQQSAGTIPIYSTTSSAIASNPDGISIPSARAVCKLMVNSNLVVCCTGISAGFAPCRTLPV
jgi:hypothetical protein